MNGKRYFLDTNTIVQLLRGNQELANTLAKAVYVATSVICEIEFLSFPGLTGEDRTLFQEFMSRVDVINLRSDDMSIKRHILTFRAKNKLKLPDAIIAASAVVHRCALLTADSQLLKMSGITVQKYQVI